MRELKVGCEGCGRLLLPAAVCRRCATLRGSDAPADGSAAGTRRKRRTVSWLLLAALAACVLTLGSAYAHNELQRYRVQERQRVRSEYDEEIRRRMAQGKTYRQAADEVIREEVKTQRHKRSLLARLLDY